MKAKKHTTILFYSVLILISVACNFGRAGIQTSPGSSSITKEPALLKPVTLLPTKIVLPTVTKAPTVTNTPTSIPSVNFSLSDINRLPPQDIFDEVSYYGQGGDPAWCETASTVPVACEFPTEAEYLMPVSMTTYGWQNNETIQVTIDLPDGVSRLDSVRSDATKQAFFSFKPAHDDPVGFYTFTFSGKSGTIIATIYYYKPYSPRLLPIDSTHMLMYGFDPYESVKLFCYDSDNEQLLGWKEVTVAKDGSQVVSADLKTCKFAALNESNQETHLLGVENVADEMDWGHSIRRTNCGGLFSRLFVHSSASVAFTDGSNMRLRAAPGFSQEVLAKISEGTRLVIMDGPQCVDNSIWWKVLVLFGDGPSSGWMTEEQNGAYLLQPEK